MTAIPPPPPIHHTHRGPHGATRAAQDYMRAVIAGITEHPRTLQRQIGPSEIGDPCSRRIGYKLLGHAERDQKPNWKATVGTGTHLWLESAFDADNLKVAVDGQERWLIETRVSVGVVEGIGEITGSCDLYDRWTASVIDHKTVGPTQLRKYKSHGPGQQYRTQANLYGYGWRRQGQPVDHVMIAFLPRNGDLDEAYLWHEPYDEQVAIAALQRLSGIALATSKLGTQALTHLPTVEAYCAQCPFYRPGSTDVALGCPGDQAAITQMAASNHQQLDGLIPA